MGRRSLRGVRVGSIFCPFANPERDTDLSQITGCDEGYGRRGTPFHWQVYPLSRATLYLTERALWPILSLQRVATHFIVDSYRKL